MLSFLQRAISSGDIKPISYKSFTYIHKISTKPSHEITKVWNDKTKSFTILKRISNVHYYSENVNDKNYTKFVKEYIKLNSEFSHNNVIRFLGSCQDSLKNFYIVLAYCNQGNLREYLFDNFQSLEWPVKMLMARQIANGLGYIHDHNIIHKRRRELPIPDTPAEYQVLYEKAWSDSPLDRPSVSYIKSSLDKMISSYYPPKKHGSFSTVDSGYSSGRQSTASSQSISQPIINIQNTESNKSQTSYGLNLYSESPPKQPAPINLQMKSNSPAQISLLQTDKQILIDRFKLDYGYYYKDKCFESTERMFKSDDCNFEYPIENNLPLVYMYDNNLNKATESNLAKISHNGTLAPYITSLVQSAIDNPQNPQKMTKLKKLCKQFLVLDATLGGSIIIRDFDINNSSNFKDLENIKAQISWTIDSAQWSCPNPFKISTSRNFNFKIEDANGTYINDLDELEFFLKRVFSFEYVKIISYDKVVPLFNQFSQQMKVKLKPVFNLHNINYDQFSKQLIDKVPETHQCLKINNWVSNNNILNLPILFSNCSLNYGLSFNSTRIIIGKRPSFQFKSEPSIVQQISKVVRFVPLDSKRNSFLLEGNCSTDGRLESLFSKNPFITNPLLKNDSLVNDMHFYIEDKQ
ncbi:4644_t:CDS:2, partial [Dentiscutata heterogama]